MLFFIFMRDVHAMTKANLEFFCRRKIILSAGFNARKHKFEEILLLSQVFVDGLTVQV